MLKRIPITFLAFLLLCSLCACSIPNGKLLAMAVSSTEVLETNSTSDSDAMRSFQDINVPNVYGFYNDDQWERWYVVNDNFDNELYTSEITSKDPFIGTENCSKNVIAVLTSNDHENPIYRFFDVDRRLISQQYFDVVAAGYGMLARESNHGWDTITYAVQDIFDPKKFERKYEREVVSAFERSPKGLFLDSTHVLLEYVVKIEDACYFLRQEVIDLSKPTDAPPAFKDICVPESARQGNIKVLGTNYAILARDDGSYDAKIYDYNSKLIHVGHISYWEIYHVTADVLSIDDKEYVNLKTGEVTTERPKPVW